MYACKDCRKPYRSKADHARDRRRIKSCNWLDGMVIDGKCPHCNGPVTYFSPSWLGDILDRLSVLEAAPSKAD